MKERLIKIKETLAKPISIVDCWNSIKEFMKKRPELCLFLIVLLENLILVLILIPSDPNRIPANYWLFGFLIGILTILPINWYIIAAVSALSLYGVRYLNEYLVSVRGRPIHFIDFYCIKDALRVSSNYKLIFNGRLGILLGTTILIAALTCYAIHKWSPHQKRNRQMRLKKACYGTARLILSALEAFLLANNVSQLDFREDVFVDNNGIFYSVFSEYINSKLQVPAGYQPGLSDQILSQYTDQQGDEAAAPDRIIVIMNESLADYALLGELDLDIDPLKNIHGLTGSFTYGKAAVNVYGGNTCNSEYEFLTGESLMFFPPNSIPYLTYTMQQHPSVVHDLNTSGYSSTAIHPYFAQEWKRSTVYSQFEFSKFISGELFSVNYQADQDINLFFVDAEHDRLSSSAEFGSNLEYLRGFITDAECYRKIMQISSVAKDADREFIFLVTVQNHGGYESMDDSEIMQLTDYHTLNEYIYLQTVSDQAISDFLKQLQDSDKKTVVLMFGDHQPSVDYPVIVKELYNKEINNDYIVPYLFWSNYETEWDTPDFVSINYLSAVLKKNCGLPLTQFDQFRLDCMEKYPSSLLIFVWMQTVNTVRFRMSAKTSSCRIMRLCNMTE